MTSSMPGDMDYNDLFGNTETAYKTGDPSKGRKYLIFTIFMCIALSVFVVMNSSEENLQKAVDERMAEQ